jgi:GNAT superfamily N-acetyltransferase
MMQTHAPPLLPHLRVATIADAAGVAALFDVLGYPCDRPEAAARIASIGPDERQRLIVADHHGDCCGLVALHAIYSVVHGADICRITAMVVAPTYQRRGIGRLLLREAHAWARANGAARIEVTSAAHRETAHAFYRRCGYAEGSLRFVKRLGDA